jgi:cell division protein FtsL
MNKKIKPKLIATREALTAGILTVFFIMGFFFKTWCGVQCIRSGYEITSALQEQQKLLDMQKNLTIEWGRLKSPQVLGKIANEQFGLTVPAPEQIIIVN